MAFPGVGNDYSFDAKLWIATVGGYQLTNWADGDIISVTMLEDQFKMKIGTTGEGTWSKTNNNSGEIIFNLMQSSPANDVLSAAMLADTRSPLGLMVPIFLADIAGTTRFTALLARCVKWPDHKTAMEAQGKSWRYQTSQLVQFHGGNFAPLGV